MSPSGHWTNSRATNLTLIWHSWHGHVVSRRSLSHTRSMRRYSSRLASSLWRRIRVASLANWRSTSRNLGPTRFVTQSIFPRCVVSCRACWQVHPTPWVQNEGSILEGLDLADNHASPGGCDAGRYMGSAMSGLPHSRLSIPGADFHCRKFSRKPAVAVELACEHGTRGTQGLFARNIDRNADVIPHCAKPVCGNRHISLCRAVTSDADCCDRAADNHLGEEHRSVAGDLCYRGCAVPDHFQYRDRIKERRSRPAQL